MCQEAANRLQPPASLALKELRNRVELRDVIRGEPDMLLELIDGPSEFLAGVRFEHFLKVAIAEIPDVLLCLGVFNPRNLTVPDSVRERLLRNHVFALPVFGIAESGVICLLDSVTR